MAKRNLFVTKTAVGVYITFLSMFLAVAPNVESLVTRGKQEDEKVAIKEWVAIAAGIAGVLVGLSGRYEAGGVYTPKYFPGEDPIELPLK